MNAPNTIPHSRAAALVERYIRRLGVAPANVFATVTRDGVDVLASLASDDDAAVLFAAVSTRDPGATMHRAIARVPASVGWTFTAEVSL
jgi:hypothetical protein